MANLLFSNNAQTTLAGSISNVAVSANLASGAGALFPSPGAGQYFMMTFVDAATGLINEIVKVTARSGDTITIVRAQEGTTAKAWSAGDLAANFWTAGQAAAMLQISDPTIRIRLTGNTTFYVATTGNDGNSGLAIGTPWLTLQHAWDIINGTYDLAGWTATVQVANGTYTAGLSAGRAMVGGNSISFVGNTGTPASCLINITAGNCFTATGGASLTLSGFKFQASGTGTNGQALATAYGGAITFSLCDFGVCGNIHINSTSGGPIQVQGNYTISGSALTHISSSSGSFACGAVTVTLTGTPAFTTFAAAASLGFIYAVGVTYTGSATGQRYSSTKNALIDTNGGGASYFPGNSAGSIATQGLYT